MIVSLVRIIHKNYNSNYHNSYKGAVYDNEKQCVTISKDEYRRLQNGKYIGYVLSGALGWFAIDMIRLFFKK